MAFRRIQEPQPAHATSEDATGEQSRTPPRPTIVFATDLRAEEGPALATATALALSAGARLICLHATRAGDADWTLPGADALARAWGRDLDAESVVHTCCEDVTDTLLDALHGLEPDLVVCGSHRLSGLSQLFSGSVAEALGRNSKVPTLVVPLDGDGLASADGRLDVRDIVVPSGDDESARAGLAAVRWWVRTTCAEWPEVVMLEIEDGASLQALDSLPAGVRAMRRPAVRSLEADIVGAADEYSASMLIMPTRGHDGLGDTLLGSHTERVLRAARRPVLIVPIGSLA